MENARKIDNRWFIVVILMFITGVVGEIRGNIIGMDKGAIRTYTILAILIVICLSLSIEVRNIRVYMIFAMLYIISLVVLLFFAPLPMLYAPVTLFGMLFAITFHPISGITANLLFSVLYLLFISQSGWETAKTEYLIIYLIFGTFAALLMKYARPLKNMCYISVILLSLYAILQIVFQYKTNQMIDYIKVGISLIVVVVELVLTIGFAWGLNYLAKSDSEKNLQQICEERYPLLANWKKKEKKSFYFCQNVARIATKAGTMIGANPDIIKAGATYHEIGKMYNKEDYVRLGISIAKKNGLPIEVANIILEHDCKKRNPQTIESAIVMLTNSILSAIEYYEKSGSKGRRPRADIVEEVMDIRLTDHSLEESGLTIKQWNELKSIFCRMYEIDRKPRKNRQNRQNRQGRTNRNSRQNRQNRNK